MMLLVFFGNIAIQVRSTTEPDRNERWNVRNDDNSAGPSGSPNRIKQEQFRAFALPPMPSPAKGATQHDTPEHRSDTEEGGLPIHTSLEVETTLEVEASVRQSVSSPISAPPKDRKQLFNPSPSASVSSPSPPRNKRVRELEEIDDDTEVNYDYKQSNSPEARKSRTFNNHPSSSASKRKRMEVDMRDLQDMQTVTAHEDQAFDYDLNVQDMQAHEPSPTKHQAVSRTPADYMHNSVYKGKRQVVDSLQALLQQTWPAVQEGLWQQV